ncbi:MAG: hypothetical protein LBL35_04945 [Clostridiales bacterium]|jgi:hypothetical protein|nr:hypothetical protein [Clostridiales bacterium]
MLNKLYAVKTVLAIMTAFIGARGEISAFYAYQKASFSSPAPESVGVKDIGVDAATVYWRDSGYDFEIVRLENEMDAGSLNAKRPFREVWDEASEKYGALVTGGDMYVFDGPADADALEIDGGFIYLRDNSLKPNRTYFYYVRASSGLEYSVWNGAAVTTLPAQGVKNLRIDLARSDLNPENEVYITFDAPASPQNVIFQYQLKEEGKQWGDATVMAGVTAAADGWVYKITGLRPGTSYSARVRAMDYSGGASPYTNEAAFRTDANALIIEMAREKADWIEYFRETFNKQRERSYWTWGGDFSVTLLRPNAPAVETAVFESDARRLTMYVPLPMQGGVSISRGDIGVLAPKGLITAPRTKSDAERFLKLAVEWGNRRQGSRRSEGLEIIAHIVEVEPGFDGEISRRAAERIEDDLGSYAEYMTRMVERGADEDRLLSAVDDITEEMSGKIANIAEDAFKNAVHDSTRVKRFAKEGFIIIKQEPYYDVKSRGESLEFFDGSRAARVTGPGYFAFEKVRVGGGFTEEIRAFAAERGLGDLIDGYEYDDAPSRGMAAACAAMVGGARLGTDPFEWLRERGANIESSVRDESLSAHEAAAYVMTLYKAKTGIDAKDVRVSKQSADISGQYAQSARAAIELGIFDKSDISGSITAGRFLEALLKADKE